MRSLALVAALGVAGVGSGAHAGRLHVEVIGEAAVSCGVERGAVEEALANYLGSLGAEPGVPDHATTLQAEVRVTRFNGVCVAAVSAGLGAPGAPLPATSFRALPAGLGGPVIDALRRQAPWLLSREVTSLTPLRLSTNASWSGKCGLQHDDLVSALEAAGAPGADGWAVTATSTGVRPVMSSTQDGMPTGQEYCASLVQVWNRTGRDAALVVTATRHGRTAREAAAQLVARLQSGRTAS